MKVYVVAIGGYEEYKIKDIYSDQTKTVAAAAKFQKNLDRAHLIYDASSDKLWQEITGDFTLEQVEETTRKILVKMGLTVQEIDDYESHSGIFEDISSGTTAYVNEYEVIE